jgi:5-hydroxyisourate hydrolase
MTLSTHVLDTATGTPIGDLPLRVERCEPAGWWATITATTTDPDGRAVDLVPGDLWLPGRWRIVFDTAAHLGPEAFLPAVTVEFATSSLAHHHVPLLLSPFGFSTYRGS